MAMGGSKLSWLSIPRLPIAAETNRIRIKTKKEGEGGSELTEELEEKGCVSAFLDNR